jgi:prevent-host-death family protein
LLGFAIRKIGAFEARNRLGQLLDLVEHGEEVVITRHGKAVARLVPPKTGFSRAEAREAAQRIRDCGRRSGASVSTRVSGTGP